MIKDACRILDASMALVAPFVTATASAIGVMSVLIAFASSVVETTPLARQARLVSITNAQVGILSFRSCLV